MQEKPTSYKRTARAAGTNQTTIWMDVVLLRKMLKAEVEEMVKKGMKE